ncbi:nicotinate phosphoribosyltransferase [Bombina bombina]|uniref:nicotinate phosphoribosyltransferase n=1 Tax=Bombina bombina TaxID=8345 RepID=UPI00235A8804|nr:nicotinate phosphoribosyltransferase [Bombina bombina]
MEQYRGQRALLTDLYQFTMAYGYWLSGRHRERAEFELFFREAPFQGGFALFFGLSDCVTYLQDFSFSPSDITYLQSIMADNVDKKFYEYLQTVDASEVTLSSFQEGSVVFAREPLIKVTGPLLVVQLLETTLLALVNYASLVGTNAARFRLAAGPHKKLVEMGLRRAQGPDGGFSASKYSYLGGFDATSNVLAGKLCGIPVSGTVAHSYVSSFTSPDEVHCRLVQVNENPCMKLSEDLEKMTIPGSKDVYRLYDSTGYPFLDLLALEGEPQTTLDQEVEFHQVGTVTETVRVTPIRAERQHIVYFKHGQRLNHESIASIELIRTHAQESLNKFSQGHLNLDDPQPYKVAVTEKLHGLLTSLRRANSLQ